MTIRWKECGLLEDARCGHGLCVYADIIQRREHLAAFVDGFGWLRGDDHAVVYFYPQLVPSDLQKLAALRAAIEARIRARDASVSELISGYWCVANG